MSGPFATAYENPRRIVIPASAQLYDRVSATAVAAVNFASQPVVGANTRAAQRVVIYLHWLSVLPTTFPAAFAAVTGFIQVQFLNAVPAVVFGPVNLKAFSASSIAAGGGVQPYVFMPPAPHMLAFSNAGLANAVAAQFICNTTAIAGVPAFTVEIGVTVDALNVGPVGAIGGGDLVAQGANNPNAF